MTSYTVNVRIRFVKTKHLKHWSIWGPPDFSTPILHGNVYGHEEIQDGQTIISSIVIGVKNGKVITKSGSEYELDDVDPNYENIFPNAKERVLQSLPQI